VKTCKDCGETKTTDQFYSSGTYLQPRCKPCHNARSAAWGRANPERVAVHRRKKNLKRKYGITPEAYEAMLEAQGGSCWICRKPPERRPLDVDHNHESGEVRGLLCECCNKAIGLLQDDPALLERAKEYLCESLG
jgi:hypothetical protein